MSKIIAFAGKGGVGKTTVATLVVRHLAHSGQTPILAVDADPPLAGRQADGELDGGPDGVV